MKNRIRIAKQLLSIIFKWTEIEENARILENN